jgi:hypothetical protein
MQCPSCRATIPELSEICPRCDAILDASFLGEEFSRQHRVPGAKEVRRPGAGAVSIVPGAPGAPAASAAPPAARPLRAPQSRAAALPAAAPAAHSPPVAAPVAYPPAPTPSGGTPAPTPPVHSSAAAVTPPVYSSAAAAAPPAFGPDVDPEVAAQREVGTRIVQLDPQREQGTRIVPIPPLPAELKESQAESRARAKRAGARQQKGAKGAASDGTAEDGEKKPKGRLDLVLDESAVSRDLDAILERVNYTFTKLDKIDRLLFYTLSATFVATLLPWIYVPGQGLLSGVQDVFGAMAAVSGAVALGAFATRAWRRLRGGYLLLLELAGAFGVAAASTYRALTLTGSPYVGLYVSVVAAGAAFLLGLVRLVR